MIDEFSVSCPHNIHKFSEWVYDGKCYERTCSVCGYTQIELNEPLGHRLQEYKRNRRKK